MKLFEWDPGKNEWLKNERGISFEEIVLAIAHDGLLDIITHPNKKKYPGQRIFIVRIDDYAYLVPFIELAKVIFLITIIPSRKATGQYLKRSREHETD